MKHSEVSPSPRVALQRWHVERRVDVNDVEEDTEYDAGEHGEKVAEGKRGENEIRGRGDHIGPR